MFMPSLLVPHRGSRYRQTTRIDVHEGGELCYLDCIAPGRVAHGESFAYAQLDFDTEIRHGGRLVVRERFALKPSESQTIPWRDVFPNGHYACWYLIPAREAAKKDWTSGVADLHSETTWIGLTQLADSFWSIKLIARDALCLRRALTDIRNLLEQAFPQFRLNTRGQIF